MSDIAFAPPPIVPPQRLVRTALEWVLLGLLTVFLGGLLVVAMVACGCSLEFALGMTLGRLFRKREQQSSRGECGEQFDGRGLRLGRALRRRLGLDALERHRAKRQKEATDRRAAARIRLEKRRHDTALRRAEIARRIRYRLRQMLMCVFASIGALALVTILITAIFR